MAFNSRLNDLCLNDVTIMRDNNYCSSVDTFRMSQSKFFSTSGCQNIALPPICSLSPNRHERILLIENSWGVVSMSATGFAISKTRCKLVTASGLATEHMNKRRCRVYTIGTSRDRFRTELVR